MLSKYVKYVRDEMGNIARDHDGVAEHNVNVDDYPFVETLRGWPEQSVQWSAEVGPTTGIAIRAK